MDFNQRAKIAKHLTTVMKTLDMPVVVTAASDEELGFLAAIADGNTIRFEAVVSNLVKDYRRTVPETNMLSRTRSIYFTGTGIIEEEQK